MILYGIFICICILILIKIYIQPATVELFVNKNRQLYFMSFGGPTEKYHNAVTRICKEAEAFDVFNHIIKVTDHDLKEDYEFWNTHGEFIEQNTRGYGYWIWKSYIIKQLLAGMQENDVLVYADAGCELNIHGKPRLLEYIAMADKSKNGIVGFELPHQEQVWTKMDLIDHLDAREQMESKQVMAGVSIIRKCPESVAMVNKWNSVYSNYHLVDDSPSILPNHNSFQEHRHDQSIFSILQKQTGGIIHKDEVDNVPESERHKFPIFAARKRG
jgi:hypothetical protein